MRGEVDAILKGLVRLEDEYVEKHRRRPTVVRMDPATYRIVHEDSFPGSRGTLALFRNMSVEILVAKSEWLEVL